VTKPSRLTIEEYEVEMKHLQNSAYLEAYELFCRLELPDLAAVRRASLVKWQGIADLRDFPCAYCAYQQSRVDASRDVLRLCTDCPVQELCHRRLALTAANIAKALAT